MNKLMQLCLFLVAIFCHPLAALANDERYDAFYVFGDSLSDTGNDFTVTKSAGLIPAIPPSESPHRTYFRGRFSNGPVAFEYLWSLLEQYSAPVTPYVVGVDPSKKGAISFAFGGAATGLTNQVPGGFFVPGLLGQVGEFQRLLGSKHPRKKALYAIWAGANDYILGLTTDPAVVVNNITQAINNLYALGGRDFLVLNQADLGLAPLIQARGLGPTFSLLTSAHNALLAQSLDNLSLSLTDAKIRQFDVFANTQAILRFAIATPPALDFVAPGTGASACLFVNPVTCPNVNLLVLAPYFFWDAEHPTTFVHALLGAGMFRLLR